MFSLSKFLIAMRSKSHSFPCFIEIPSTVFSLLRLDLKVSQC